MVTSGVRRRVVCALIERGGAVLAACRREDRTNGGLWEFPGGKVRDGESLFAALGREIREELGVEITVVRELPPVAWKYPWISIELFPFVCSIAGSGEPRPLDHAALRFITGSEASELPWAPADREIVEGYYGDAGTDGDNSVEWIL